MWIEHRSADRLPTLANSADVPEDERADYERALEIVRKYSSENDVARARPLVDGRPYAYDYRVAWTNAPRLNSRLRDASYAAVDYQGEPGWFTAQDHEMINLVLGFDSGYWAFHAGHTPNAISVGVRIEALEALRDGREDDLTDDERRQVEFIRAVRDGAMTDEIWSRMVSRLGSVAGVIGFAFLTCMLWTHMRMMGAFGLAAIAEDEWDALLEDYREGAKDPSAATQDYVWKTANREAH